MLSAHFSIEELVATQHRGVDNAPPPDVIENLKLLAGETLEEVRYLLGPVHITSGYRSPELNRLVGGQPTSQHCDGLAADLIVPRFSRVEAVRRILAQHVIFDQLIYEHGGATPAEGGWIHVSHAPVGRLARGEALMVGKWTDGRYLPLDLSRVP